MVCLEKLPRTIDLQRGADGRMSFSFVDQTKLPGALVRIETQDWFRVVRAIKSLEVRGAPAIGVSGAAALALWASEESTGTRGGLRVDRAYWDAFDSASDRVRHARPTAVNLAWAVERVRPLVCHMVEEGSDRSSVADALFACVKRMETEDEEVNRAIGAFGAPLLAPGSSVLTHCNAGSLATTFFGTALGIVYAAAKEGKIARVYADETRPVGQGARLTTWELAQVGIPVTLICDDMAASLMATGKVDAVLVGADRICANGDVANKIGTYGVAVLARHHGIPFYVAAPTSTIDLSLERGAQVPIEERDPAEVATDLPRGVSVWNPAFDVTPSELVTGIVTERGVFLPAELHESLMGSSF